MAAADMEMNDGEPQPLLATAAEAARQETWSPVQRRFMAVLFTTVVSVPPLVWGLWERFKDVQTIQMTDGGRSYEGGWGIFGTIAAVGSSVILLYYLLNFLCMSDVALENLIAGGRSFEGFPQSPCLPSYSESHHDFRVLQPDFMRYGKFAWKVLMALMNTAFIVLTFKDLPERDPEKRLNEARWFVACFEGAVMVILWCGATVNSLLLRNSAGLALWMQRISGFSALGGLTFASPGKAWDSFQTLSKRGIPKAVALFLVCVTAVFLGGCGLMALNGKLNQVDFVTERAAGQWSVYQWFTLACFVNNLFGIMPDSNEPRIQGIFHFIANTDNGFLWTAVKDKWSDEFVDRFGLFDATVIFATLSSKDVIRLLNKNPWTEDDYQPVEDPDD